MQLINVEKKENSLVELTISVDKETFETALEQAYRKNVGKMTIPGFRKGKAPRKMVEKLFGEGVFYEDAVNACYPEAYDAAVVEAKLDGVGHPDVAVEEIADGGFRFKATVPVKPEVTIKDYKGISAEKIKVSVTEKDVKEELARMADRNSRLVAVERAVENDDTVIFDFEGSVDGVPFDGGKAENYSLKIGSGMFIPGFEAQMIGKTIGTDFNVEVTFPEEYQAKELAGKPAVFKCKIHEVKVTEKPEIDDEFAKDVSEFDTLDELKGDIKAKIKEGKEKASENEYEEKLIDGMLENMTAEIPEIMFETQIDRIVEDFGYRLSMQGITLDAYLQMNQLSPESFRKLFREQAEKQVKVRLSLEEIAKIEKLEVSDEDLEKEFATLAEQNKMEVARVKELLPAESLKGDLLTQKAVELIKSAAVAKAPAAKAAKAEKTEKAAKPAKKAPAKKKAEPKE